MTPLLVRRQVPTAVRRAMMRLPILPTTPAVLLSNILRQLTAPSTGNLPKICATQSVIRDPRTKTVRLFLSSVGWDNVGLCGVLWDWRVSMLVVIGLKHEREGG